MASTPSERWRGFPISCRPPEKRRHYYSKIPFSIIHISQVKSQTSSSFSVLHLLLYLTNSLLLPLIILLILFHLPFFGRSPAPLCEPLVFFYLFRLSLLLFNTNFNPVYLAEVLWCPWPPSAIGFLSLHRPFPEKYVYVHHLRVNALAALTRSTRDSRALNCFFFDSGEWTIR